MSYRTTAVLLVVLALFGAYMYFFGSGKKEAEVAGSSDLDVLDLEVGSLRSMEVRQGDKVVLVQRNPQGGWDLAKPEQFEGDQPRLVNVAESLATLRASRVLTDVADLSPFGFDKPEMKVTLGVGSSDFVELVVGSENPAGSGSYVKRPDSNTVYLVGSYDINLLKSLIIELPKARPTPTPEPLPSPTASPTPGG